MDTASDPAEEPCILATASCTTGWLDWIHGELWVCADGLLRRALGLRATVAHGSQPTVNPGSRARRVISSAERYLISQASPTNRWIAWQWVAAADLRRGPLTDSFHYRLADGTRGKLLWLRLDDPDGLVFGAAMRNLGDRVSARPLES